MGNWWDDMDDYVPVDERKDDQKDNPNIITLDKVMNINLCGWVRTEFERFLGDGNAILIKDTSISIDYNGESFEVFQSREDSDVFAIRNGDDIYSLNVYESNNYYIDDNKITFNGWDYNIIFNMENRSFKTIYVR